MSAGQRGQWKSLKERPGEMGAAGAGVQTPRPPCLLALAVPLKVRVLTLVYAAGLHLFGGNQSDLRFFS